MSKADSCTSDSRLMLKFQACPDVLNTESTGKSLPRYYDAYSSRPVRPVALPNPLHLSTPRPPPSERSTLTGGRVTDLLKQTVSRAFRRLVGRVFVCMICIYTHPHTHSHTRYCNMCQTHIHKERDPSPDTGAATFSGFFFFFTLIDVRDS